MPQMVTIDFNKPMLFECAPWTVTTWEGTLKGIRSNAISHGQATSFTVTAKFMYFKIGYTVSSEAGYDKFRLTVDGVVKVNTGSITSVYEQSFTDGADHTLKFEYYKDGSGSAGLDATFINEMVVQTVDDSLTYMEVCYLIKSATGVLYTLVDGVLTELADQTLSGENFLANGMREPPNGIWVAGLPNPKILYWQDTLSERVPKVTALLKANPQNQIVLTWEADMDEPSIVGIASMTADLEGFVSITLTFDHNTTWWAFNGTQWEQTTQDAGMSKSVLNAITGEKWAELLTLVKGSLQYRVSFVLDETSILKRFDVKYINAEV